MTTTELAATHGLSKASLDSFLDYMRQELAAKPNLVAWLKKDHDACMKAGIKAWLNASKTLMAELMAGETQRAQAFKTQIAADVWHHHNQG